MGEIYRDSNRVATIEGQNLKIETNGRTIETRIGLGAGKISNLRDGQIALLERAGKNSSAYFSLGALMLPSEMKPAIAKAIKEIENGNQEKTIEEMTTEELHAECGKLTIQARDCGWNDDRRNERIIGQKARAIRIELNARKRNLLI